VHWWILQFSIGLITSAVFLEIKWRRSNDEVYLEMAKTISKVSVVIFAVGAVTGTLSEFGLILLWPNFLNLAGKYFFFPMYLEIFAFLAETVFIYMYFYTWDRVKPNFHLSIGVMAAVGAIMSGLLILSVNNLMNIPFGLNPSIYADGEWVSGPTYDLVVGGSTQTLTSAELRNVWLTDIDSFNDIMLATVKSVGIFGVVFKQPGVLITFAHTILSAILTTTFTILGVYSWRYLKVEDEKKKDYYRKGLKFFSLYSFIFISIQGIFGHQSGVLVGKYNPEKLAAMEATTDSYFSVTGDIPLIGGLIEKMIAFLAYGDFNAKLPNYDSIPPEWQVPIIIHYLYYLKMSLAILMGLNAMIMTLYFYAPSKLRKLTLKGRQLLPEEPHRFMLKANVFSPIIIQLIGTLGWMTKEIGRKPWTIYGIMTVDEAARPTELSLWIIIVVMLYICTLGFGLLTVVYLLFRMDNEEGSKDEKPTEKKSTKDEVEKEAEE
jgi:cytochrome d ubiquinol oxidase subunit I